MEKDFKITALTLELAYYRHIRFGKARETLLVPDGSTIHKVFVTL